MTERPHPEAAPRPQQEYFAHLAEGRFMIQRSRSSGEYVFFPRVAAPRTGALDLEWVPASGRGTVYATTVMRVRPPAPSYNVCLVELEEGPRMLSNLVNVEPDPKVIECDMPVEIVYSRLTDDIAIPLFQPAR